MFALGQKRLDTSTAGYQGNHQKFEPSLLSSHVDWYSWEWSKPKKLKKKKKWPTQKKYFFAKISGIGPWVSKINWCEGHWYGSTYMVIKKENNIRSPIQTLFLYYSKNQIGFRISWKYMKKRRSWRDKYAPNKFCADVEAKPVLYSSHPPPDFETFRRLW